MGSDLTVVNAARVSFNKQVNTFSEKDAKLIRYLAKNGHWTPFGHPQVTLRETVPIFVARQRFKHMVGFVYNEVSRRYVDDGVEFYTPLSWRKRAEDKKQGSSEEVVVRQDIAYKLLSSVHYDCETTYKSLLELGVAPEQARMVLPQSMYTSYYVTGSLAAWTRAYNLRSDLHAQLEIRELAKQWKEIIEPLFPVSFKALTQKGIENA